MLSESGNYGANACKCKSCLSAFYDDMIIMKIEQHETMITGLGFINFFYSC